MKRTRNTWIVTAIVIALILSACANQQTPSPEDTSTTPVAAAGIVAEGHLVPAQDATLGFQGSGTVLEVSVEVGDKVREGQVLARLGGASDAAYAAAQLELVSAQQALDNLLESEEEARAQALIDLDDAEEAYDKAEEYYDSLFEPYEYYRIVFLRYITPVGIRRVPTIKKVKVDEADDETIADAKADLDLKLAKFNEAQRAYDRVKDGPDTDQLALLEARLHAARAGVAAFAVIAPFDGVVMDVNVGVGEQVASGAWALKIADTSAWYVETSDLTELDVVKVSVGQPVTILADALPDAPMTGAVESISQAFTSSGGDILYEVKIKVDSIDPRALWGMTVEVTFEPLEQ